MGTSLVRGPMDCLRWELEDRGPMRGHPRERSTPQVPFRLTLRSTSPRVAMPAF